jgi:hypothetical protein
MVTYNLTIDALHTYYVEAGSTPVLVHNSADECGPWLGGSVGDQAPLRMLHPVSSLNKSSLDYWSKQETQSIVKSLAPDQAEPLIVKSDGTIIRGNTRFYVLQQRGYDVNNLLRIPYSSDLPDDGFWE